MFRPPVWREKPHDEDLGPDDEDLGPHDEDFGHIDEDFGHVDEDFGHVDEDLEHIDEYFGHIDVYFGHVDKDFGHVDEDFGHVDKDFGHVDEDFERIDEDFGHVDEDFGHVDEDFGHLAEAEDVCCVLCRGRLPASLRDRIPSYAPEVFIDADADQYLIKRRPEVREHRAGATFRVHHFRFAYQQTWRSSESGRSCATSPMRIVPTRMGW